MIWVWSMNEYDTQDRLAKMYDYKAENENIFLKAGKMDGTIALPDLKMYCKRSQLTDCIITDLHVPIVSHRVLDILTKTCPEDFQHFEANLYIKGKNKKAEGYFFINVLKSVDVRIKEPSLIEQGEFFIINELQDMDMARDEDSPDILISQRLKDIFENKMITGVNFQSIRPIPLLIQEGHMMIFKWPDTGEEFGYTVSYPIEIDETIQNRKTKLIVKWQNNIPLTKQIAILKMVCPSVKDLSNKELLTIAKSNVEWDMGEFIPWIAEDIALKAKRYGIVIRRVDFYE